MSKHTAGKWIYYTHPQPNGCPIVGTENGLMVCQLAHSIHDNVIEALANAKLISAAPELFALAKESAEMLERIMANDDWGAIEEHIQDLRAAIAKATGGE